MSGKEISSKSVPEIGIIGAGLVQVNFDLLIV